MKPCLRSSIKLHKHSSSCPFAVKSLGQCCLTSYYLSVRNLSKKRKRQTKSRGFSLSVLLHPAQSTSLSETFPKKRKRQTRSLSNISRVHKSCSQSLLGTLASSALQFWALVLNLNHIFVDSKIPKLLMPVSFVGRFVHYGRSNTQCSGQHTVLHRETQGNTEQHRATHSAVGNVHHQMWGELGLLVKCSPRRFSRKKSPPKEIHIKAAIFRLKSKNLKISRKPNLVRQEIST